jgi:hypothetical protein
MRKIDIDCLCGELEQYVSCTEEGLSYILSKQKIQDIIRVLAFGDSLINL